MPPTASSTDEGGVLNDVVLIEVTEGTTDIADSPFRIRDGLAVGVLLIGTIGEGEKWEVHLGSIHIVLTLTNGRGGIVAVVGILLY